MHRTIAAGRQGAGIQTRIGAQTVAVITGLKAFFACLQIQALNAIAAGCYDATIGTSIALVFVAIITGFAGVHAVVAAGF